MVKQADDRSPCLADDEVSAFTEAKLGDDALVRIGEHANGCTTCERRLLEAAAAGGSTTGTVRLEWTPPRARASRKPLERGQVFGRYTVLGPVGRGGMGEVYAAYDPSLDRRVALKLLLPGASEDSERARARLQREAKSIAKLSHANVVVVHEVGTFEDQVFVAMEFIEGPTLASWLVAKPRAWRDILAIFVQAARGLSAAHQAGLVHRDFKPSNVMIGKDGTARVMDFGLARSIDGAVQGPELALGDGDAASTSTASGDPQLTQTNGFAGTPLYMAPEQLTGGRLDARADQFSFCVSLHWALFGVHPLADRKGEAAVSTADADAGGPKPKASGAPQWIQKVLARGLKTDPAARWPSMDDLAAALVSDSTPRRRTLARAIALVTVLLAAGGLYAYRATRPSCEGGPARLEGAWEGEGALAKPGSRRQTVRDAILKSGTAEPAQTWQRVALLLDEQTTNWLGMYREACEATHVRGDQSQEVLDLRMSCLNDNLDSTRALTELLSGGDRAVVDHAVEAASTLGDLSRCAALEQLRSAPRPPKDPLLRTTVADLSRLLREARALRDAGQYQRAETLADTVVKRSEEIGWDPTEAEGLLLKGLSQEFSNPSGSDASFMRALVVAERCGHDRAVAEAAVLLGYSSRGRPGGERWFDLATAALKRIGGDPRLEVWLANNVGALRYMRGRWDDARREFERAIELESHATDLDKLDESRTSSNLSLTLAKLRRFDEALVASKRAVTNIARWVSGDSPTMAQMIDNHADVLMASGQVDAAEQAYRRSLKIYDAALIPPDSPMRFMVAMGLGKVALTRGRPAEAVRHYEPILGVLEKAAMSESDIAETRFRLAVALYQSGGDGARARALAQKALDTYAAAGTFEEERREIRAWLAARTAPRERAVVAPVRPSP